MTLETQQKRNRYRFSLCGNLNCEQIAVRMIQYLDPVPGNKLHSIRTPIIKSITHIEACNEVSTQALCSKPYRLLRGPSRKSSRGLVLVCVFPQMTVNPLFCVEGFVGLVINARVSMNVYVCVAERGYQAGRGPVPSVTANGSALFDCNPYLLSG